MRQLILVLAFLAVSMPTFAQRGGGGHGVVSGGGHVSGYTGGGYRGGYVGGGYVGGGYVGGGYRGGYRGGYYGGYYGGYRGYFGVGFYPGYYYGGYAFDPYYYGYDAAPYYGYYAPPVSVYVAPRPVVSGGVVVVGGAHRFVGDGRWHRFGER